MSRNDAPFKEPLSKQQIAEAAAWMAHLHGSQRTPDSDKGHQLWLKEDPTRARAWEAATEAWADAGILEPIAIAKGIRCIAPAARRRTRPKTRLVALAAALAAAAAFGITFLARSTDVTTGVGEQRVVTLDDGSRAILNTATRIAVNYNDRVRKIELKSGEARFDVAKESGRPFVVLAGNRQITALGTSFVVRYDPDRIAITLVDGKVSVSATQKGADLATPTDRTPTADAQTLVTLSPGQRLTYTTATAPHIDQPPIDKVVAWQQGQVVMDGMRFADAVAEMNRYSARKIQVDQPEAAAILISGVFKSADSMSFANAVANTYQLEVADEGGKIILKGSPSAAYRK